MADRNGLLDRYLHEIGKQSLLTPAEEIKLAKLIKVGGKKGERAKQKMIQANLRFVVSVAKQYQGQGLPLSDLINEGNMGLIKASERFDESKGFKFISYAVWWIRQSVLQALAEQSRVVRLPLNKVGAVNKISKTIMQLKKKFEREPTTEEIAEVLETTELEITETLKVSEKQLSIDAPFSNGDDNRLLDVLKDDKNPTPDRELYEESRSGDIHQILDTLSFREREVVSLYFGIGEDQSYTLEEIGSKYGLTRERVRQIKENAIRKLRHKSRANLLREYIE